MSGSATNTPSCDDLESCMRTQKTQFRSLNSQLRHVFSAEINLCFSAFQLASSQIYTIISEYQMRCEGFLNCTG